MIERPDHHKCPVPRCKHQVRDAYLMCPHHWFKVPQDVRTAIYEERYRGTRRQTHPTPTYTAKVRQALDHIAAISQPKETATLHA